MTTVGNVVDRVLQEHIRPATEQPAVCFTAATATDADTTVVLACETLSVTERSSIQPSAIIEIGSELLLVRSVTESGTEHTVTVKRGWQGTTPAAIGADEPVIISPAITRLNVFNAVADEIVALYPGLWNSTTVALAPSSTYVELPATAEEIELFRGVGSNGRPHNLIARIVRDFPDSTTGVAATFDGTGGFSSGYLTYKASFALPTDEADTLADLGVQNDWIAVLVLGAAARTVVQLDPRALSVEFVADLQQTEGSPPGTPTAVAQRLRRWRDQEYGAALARWRVQHPTRVVMTDPLRPGVSAG